MPNWCENELHIAGSTEKESEADRFKGLPVSYKRVVLKTLSVSSIWIIIIGLLCGFLFLDSGYPFETILVVALFQLPIILFVSIFNTLIMKKRKLLPWPAEGSNWSRLRRFLTFPDHVFDNQKTIYISTP